MIDSRYCRLASMSVTGVAGAARPGVLEEIVPTQQPDIEANAQATTEATSAGGRGGG